MEKTRVQREVTRAEATKRVTEEAGNVGKEPERDGIEGKDLWICNPGIMHTERRMLLAFTVTVINCASERIRDGGGRSEGNLGYS